MLKPNDIDTVHITHFMKKLGFNQHIDTVTRPNKKGGCCIDLLMTDNYVHSHGTLDDFVSDHYTIYCKSWDTFDQIHDPD